MSEGPSHASSFDDNDYSRPNQPWSCGWADEGHACPLGPTKWGICRSSHECSPYKKGDTWTCARTKAHGGACEEGPLPDGTCCKQIQKCQPRRSIMSQRGVLSFSVFAAALAIAFIILGAPNRKQLASPGDLTSHHSQIADRCDACHSSASGSTSDWVKASFDRVAAHEQTDQCLKCHEDLGFNAKHAHGQPPSVLSELTSVATQQKTTLASITPEVIAARALQANHGDVHQDISCATCHREHRGTKANLTELTNQQCQVCHAKAFDSFSHGHPEFVDYPYKRRTRFYFDHMSHYGKHFFANGGDRDFSCSDCHEPDSAGRYMLVKKFDSTCSDCHSHQIEDDTTLGLTVLSLPKIDVESLRKNGRTVGQWPTDYPVHVEATSEIAPLQQLLMQSYDDYESVRSELGDADLGDLREADSAQLEAAESMLWLLKESLHDVVQHGHPEVKRRFNSALRHRMPEKQIATLTNLFPIIATVDMQQSWLPDLAKEVESRRANTTTDSPESSTIDVNQLITDERQQSERLSSGWYLHASSLSLRYRPSGHADLMIKTLFDTAATVQAQATQTELLDVVLDDLLQQVSSPFAAGRCTKCHTMDSAEDTSLAINWNPYQPRIDHHDFTRFNHASHMTLHSDAGCAECHTFSSDDTEAKSLFDSQFINADWLPSVNPHTFDSNFSPMSKDSCATCHSKDTGRDRCLTCHNYHVR